MSPGGRNSSSKAEVRPSRSSRTAAMRMSSGSPLPSILRVFADNTTLHSSIALVSSAPPSFEQYPLAEAKPRKLSAYDQGYARIAPFGRAMRFSFPSAFSSRPSSARSPSSASPKRESFTAKFGSSSRRYATRWRTSPSLTSGSRRSTSPSRSSWLSSSTTRSRTRRRFFG